ncbi:Putative MhmaT1 transposase, partial [Caligus rogercresseyi]
MHKAKTVQAWLNSNVPHFWYLQTWPSNSPYLNPCDYYLKGEDCATHHNYVAGLKSSITSVAMSMKASEVSSSVWRPCWRLQEDILNE